MGPTCVKSVLERLKSSSVFWDESYEMNLLADAALKLYVSAGERGVSVEVERMASKVSKLDQEGDGLYKTRAQKKINTSQISPC